jgi:hypothetical protein
MILKGKVLKSAQYTPSLRCRTRSHRFILVLGRETQDTCAHLMDALIETSGAHTKGGLPGAHSRGALKRCALQKQIGASTLHQAAHAPANLLGSSTNKLRKVLYLRLIFRRCAPQPGLLVQAPKADLLARRCALACCTDAAPLKTEANAFCYDCAWLSLTALSTCNLWL